MNTVSLQCVHGEGIAPWLADIARLRIMVFAEWPYLYQGDAAYEAGYLRVYARSPRSIAVLALDADGGLVGVSTGLPLEDEDAAFHAPLREAGIDPARVFYCGESVLLPHFRGRGLGHAFFDAREAHARALGGFSHTAFAAVERAADDPRRPAAHRGNEAFWHKRGYRKQDIHMQLDWREPGLGEVSHRLAFWLRPLEEDR
ncbi:GNAT family N-acetyltransferase [Luteimonas sp. e5]